MVKILQQSHVYHDIRRDHVPCTITAKFDNVDHSEALEMVLIFK